MAQNFKPGDLVRLKSGGPVMTVEKANIDFYEQWEGTTAARGLLAQKIIIEASPRRHWKQLNSNDGRGNSPMDG